MYIRDQVGNSRNLGQSELATMGFATSFQNAATLTSIEIGRASCRETPAISNTSTSSETNDFDAHIDDDISGLEQTDITLRSPSGQTVVALFRVYERISSTSLDVTYR